MAKFKQQNLELKDSQKLILDSAKAKYLTYDGSETAINTTLSGVTPTGDGHLTTKAYVDSAITTATGSLTTDHGGLTGLDDDDHSNIYYNKTAVDGKWATWSGTIDHDTILNNHNLTTDIDHNTITNNHNLTTDIDHDQLTNYVSGEHFTEGNIDHTSIQNIGSTSHADIDTALAAFTSHSGTATIHFTEGSIDHDNITNTHNLTTDIDHDAITNNHNLTTDIDHDAITNNHNLTTDIDHDALTNFAAGEHFTEASIDHTSITNIGTNAHSAIDTHLARLPTPDAGDDGLYLNWDNSGGVYVFTTASGGAGTAGQLDLGAIKTVNEEYSGIVIQGDVSETPEIGDVLYQESNFKFALGTAASGTENPIYAMATTTATGIQDVMLQGQLCNTAWDWSAGMLWLSTAGGGAMTQTVASGVGQTVQPVGFALSADTVYFTGYVGHGRL